MAALTEAIEARLYRWCPFALLLVAGASRWIVSAARLGADSTLASEALGCGWAALLSLTWLSWRRKRTTEARTFAGRSRWRDLLGGAMIFGGPAVALLFGGRQLDAGSLTIALALTPVVIAIATSALGTERTDGIAGRIWPGLAAVAGLLLILAQPLLTDARGDLELLLAPALTGLGAALVFSNRPTFAASTSTVTYALAGASAVFAAALAEHCLAGGFRPSISILAVAFDGVLALLSIISLAQLGATRWSSQFTWVPLLIVLEGIVLVRSQLSAYWIVGLTLLGLASIYLVLPGAGEPTSRTSPIPD